MAANAEKTIEYAFLSKVSGCVAISATSLNLSERYEFTPIGITIPETASRSFKSVILEIYARDATLGNFFNVNGRRMGIQLGTVAFEDTDYTTVVASQSDYEEFIFVHDVTDYFNNNFGTSASQSCSVAYAQWSSGSTYIQNLNAKLYITYEYESSASRTIKTVRIPIQSASVVFPNTNFIELGTQGLNAAPVNQIPALDTFLPETNKEYKSIWFEMFGNDGGTGTTVFSGSYRINNEAFAARSPLQEAGNTATFYHDNWVTKYTNGSGVIIQEYPVSGSEASALYVASSLAARFDALGSILHVTYEYDTTSASVMNSIILALNDPSMFVSGTSASYADCILHDLWVTEENPILAQSGILMYAQIPNTGSTYLLSGSQVARNYNIAISGAVVAGGYSIIHRIDHNSGFNLSRGKNTLDIKVYSAVARTTTMFNGLAYINYTSARSSKGEENHNHTTIWSVSPGLTSGTPTTNYVVPVSVQHTPNIISDYYYLNGIGYQIGNRWSGAALIISYFEAQTLANEYDGIGRRVFRSSVFNSDDETGTYPMIFESLENFNLNQNDIGKMNIETAREYFLTYSLSTAPTYWIRTFLTYHTNTFTVSGSFSNPAGSGSNVRVDAYRYTDGYWSGSTTSTASGSYILNVLDNVYPYFASASQDGTHIGRSASALAV